MSWFKIDDGFHGHRKVWRIPARDHAGGIALWVMAGSWSSNQGTDGFIPTEMLRPLRGTDRAAAALVGAGLWEEVTGGWRFHDWAAYNPTAADVRQRRAGDANRQRKVRERRANAREPGTSAVPARTNDVRVEYEPGTNPVHDDADQGKPTNVTRDAPDASAPPDPTRPDPVLPSEVLPDPTPPDARERAPDPTPGDRFTADTEPVRAASRRWARLLVDVADEANDWADRLTPTHGRDQAVAIVTAALTDPTTRKGLGRLGAAPGYVADLRRQLAGQAGSEERRQRGRPVKLPACVTCGAGHGDSLGSRTVTAATGGVEPCPDCRSAA